MNNKIVIDTHILLWCLIEPQNLSDDIKEVISKAQSQDNLYIASITLWEVAMLVSKKRINVYIPIRDFLTKITDLPGLNIIDISAATASDSVNLPREFTGDPADCMIIAATREIAGTLITRDQKIIDLARSGHVKIISG